MSAPLRVFVLIDGLGWRVLQGRDFLDDLLPYRKPLRTILGYSSGAIPTMLTGRSPAEHGAWNLLYYDPEHSPFRWLRSLEFLPRSVMNHRVTRKALKEMGRHVLGLGSLFECTVSPHLLPWFNWAERRNIYAPGGLPGARSIFDHLAETRRPVRTYTYHQMTDARIFEAAENDISSGAASIFFVYLSELDLFLHHHRHEEDHMGAKLDEYARGLRVLFECGRARTPDFRFSIFSDHGMTPVTAQYPLVDAVARLGFDMPSDYLAVYDSTMARFWFFNDKARDAITGVLNDLPCGRVLSDAELENLGVLFPDRRYGELVALLDPGWLIAGSEFNGNGWRPSGMHGYHPDDPDSFGVFLSNEGPPVTVNGLADVYSFMRATIP